jgi:predicted aspartyl protease
VLAILGGGSAPIAQPTGPELATGVVRVAMSHADGQVVVPVRVDGQGPFLFRIDTGSAVPAAIDAQLAQQLGLPPASDGSASFSIERLDLGGATFRGVQAAPILGSPTDTRAGPLPVAPTAHVQGVLGFPLFHDVLLTIDYAGGAIELQRGALTGEDEGVLPLVGSTDTPQVPMQVGDQVYLARIDTGFADNVVLPLDAADQLRTDAAPATVGRVHADGQSREARSARLTDSLLVAGRRYDRLPVLFADVPSGARIGYGLLAYFKLTFDQTAGLVRITPTESAG